MKTASFLPLPIVLACLCLTGCATLQNLFKPSRDVPRTQLTAQPTLEQITSTVNRNSQSIRNMTTENASISVAGVPFPLHAKLAFERPKRLRIQGSVSSLGNREFDFGSNDDLFWLWIRNRSGGGNNEMWYCRHDQYHISPVRSAIPIDPDWLIEALGMVEFKPTDQHFGPTRLNDGHWEIISHCNTASGQFTKRTVIDSTNDLVRQLELYTPQNELIASAEASDPRYDKGASVSYMKRISVRSQGMEGKMTIDLGSPAFNSSVPVAASTFVMQTFEGYRAVDLCSPEFLQPRGTIMPMSVQEPSGVPVPEASIQTVIR